MKHSKIIFPTACGALALAIVACTPTNPGSGGSLKTVVGPISGFGSIFVNGVEYNTDRAKVMMDGVTARIEDLSPGMKVTLTGTDDGTNGVAHTIDFEDDLEGTVDVSTIPTGGSTGTITIMGQTVTITSETVFESEVLTVDGIDKITSGMVCEVSGHANPDGSITATFIEVEADNHTDYLSRHAEGTHIKGLVSNLNATAMTFNVGNQVVDYTNATMYGFVDLANDLYVVVKSTTGVDGSGVLVADVVGIVGDGEWGHDWKIGERFAVKGRISVGIANDIFEVNGEKVQLGPNVELRGVQKIDLVKGTYVAVEGAFDANGIVVATKVIGIRFSDAFAFGSVSAITVDGTNTGTVTVGGKTININNDTTMLDGIKDLSHTVDTMFNLQGLAEGDFVVIRYYTDSVEGMVATYLVKINFSMFSSMTGQ